MPFKHDVLRRHRIPPAHYRVTNWPAYEAGLRRRGDLTFWVNEAALAPWPMPERAPAALCQPGSAPRSPRPIPTPRASNGANEHRPKIHGTNPLEHVNKGIERRTDVVGILPDEAAVVRLVDAILLEQSDEWAIQRRYMSPETLAAISDADP